MEHNPPRPADQEPQPLQHDRTCPMNAVFPTHSLLPHAHRVCGMLVALFTIIIFIPVLLSLRIPPARTPHAPWRCFNLHRHCRVVFYHIYFFRSHLLFVLNTAHSCRRCCYWSFIAAVIPLRPYSLLSPPVPLPDHSLVDCSIVVL